MKVKYAGPAKDYSGYGEANRHDIGALHAAGVELTTQIPIYTPEQASYGRLGELAASFEGRDLGYEIKIIHTTPNVYRQYFENGKYHIARAFWETDKVPLDFALNLQMADEIWTGSEFNKQAMQNSGVTKPIFVIPEAIDDTLDLSTVKPYITANKETYKFYSIFEWTERKNPMALLEAYWREFEGCESVSLTLKTYLVSFAKDKKETIEHQIKKLKQRLNLKHYADVYLKMELLDRYQIYRFHRTFDCFVSAHRGEGWGVPQMEAMLMGNSIISTDRGGIHEYLTHKKDAFLVKNQLVPIKNMEYNAQWYTPDQNWGEVDIEHLREGFRWAYDNQDEARNMGNEGRITVESKFGLRTVGKIMRERLEQIQSNMEPKL